MTDEDLRLLHQLADRQAIHDCLLRYTRGVDRLDRALMLSAYHPDAIDDHGSVVLGAADFVDWALDYHRRHNLEHHHGIGNVTIEIDGDTAHAESCYTFVGINAEPPDILSFGRYIDRLERRDGCWAIAQRLCVTEAVHDLQPSRLPPEDRARLFSNGPRGRDRGDASYQRPLILARADRAALREGVPG